jgi:membrane protein
MIDLGYYPVLIVLLMIGLTTFYKLAPPRRLPWHRGLPGATLAVLVFLGGSAALRTYISFLLDKNHAYVTLAAPIAALLFFFVLALGVLLGAEFNAAIQERAPAKPRTPRVLDPRNWQKFEPEDAAAAGGACGPQPEHAPVRLEKVRTPAEPRWVRARRRLQLRKLS